jgi:hypothetical protein
LKANPDSAPWPVRQRALEDGKTIYMAVPRLASAELLFALDPAHLSESPRKAASISGAARSGRQVSLADLTPFLPVNQYNTAWPSTRSPTDRAPSISLLQSYSWALPGGLGGTSTSLLVYPVAPLQEGRRPVRSPHELDRTGDTTTTRQ